VRALGSDQYGAWYGAHRGVRLQRGTEPPISWACDFAVLVPATGNWIACFNSAGKYAIYVDVTGPISNGGSVIRAVDLDLDVVRLPDGAVQLLDQDEFADHQLRFQYPRSVTAEAERNAQWLMDAVRSRREPFGDVGPAWLARLSPAT
jgi:predicted RNA-binding protein associated with RNAse of E/G family